MNTRSLYTIAILSVAMLCNMAAVQCMASDNKIPAAVVVPSTGEKAYKIAADKLNLPPGDVVLIGSDSVNPTVHDLISRGVIEGLDLEYGGDGYRILCVKDKQRRYLIIAGGSGRSTIYAVYDFFRRRAGAEYFWDGDVVPRRPEIDFEGIDVVEKPRFQYRGLRYFAHRGLHRFQAEHWDLQDWKREIDWLLKKRFNLFMLRIGHDDIFQRAFPGKVPYPPTDGKDPDAHNRSYNDRTSFWQLKYRGELRKKVLQYARDRGLIHPEDAGTITHWYSHTPSSFYRSFPDFPVSRDQTSHGYRNATMSIWDIETQRAWDTYWKLTETHIREFGEPRMFHTIGLAERMFGKTRRDNLQRKLYVYRKTQQNIRKHYPDAPLLIAGWDLTFSWKDDEVRQLLKEFDPSRTIILDYTADDPAKVSYADWKMIGRFPWIFGIFHGFARNNDMHEDYSLLAQRLKTADGDAMCRGLVLWSEISHNDTFMLEYLADNSWRPDGLQASDAMSRYCRTRYPKQLARQMQPLWTTMLKLSQCEHWSLRGPQRFTFDQPQFQMFGNQMWVHFSPAQQKAVMPVYKRIVAALKPAPAMLHGLADLAEKYYVNPLWRRDALDMARTTANRVLCATVVRGARLAEAWRHDKAALEDVRQMAELNRDLLAALADILAQSDDFSMAASLERLNKARTIEGVDPKINPHSEQTLKGNAENGYCRSQHYELVRHVYGKEADAFWNIVLKHMQSGDRSPWKYPKEFGKVSSDIKNQFYATPLAKMAPQCRRGPKQMAQALRRLAELANKFQKFSQKDTTIENDKTQ